MEITFWQVLIMCKNTVQECNFKKRMPFIIVSQNTENTRVLGDVLNSNNYGLVYFVASRNQNTAWKQIP